MSEVQRIGELVERVGRKLREEGDEFLRRARDFEAAGFPKGGASKGATGSHGDPTGNARRDRLDSAHSEAQQPLRVLWQQASVLEVLFHRVMDTGENTGRESSVEQCRRCMLPILPPARVKRLDGWPFHDISPGDGLPACHSAEWRDRRKSA